MSEYRILEKDEIIKEGDEDDAVWVPAKNIGEPAPDPRFPAHRIYRRKVDAQTH